MTIQKFKALQARLDQLGISNEMKRISAKNYNCIIDFVVVKNYKQRKSAIAFFERLVRKKEYELGLGILKLKANDKELINFLQWHTNENKPFGINELVNILGSIRRFRKHKNKKSTSKTTDLISK